MLVAALLVHLFIPHHSNNHRAKLLHPHLIATIGVLFSILQISLFFLPSLIPQAFAYPAQIKPQAILEYTNQARREAGVSPLHFDDKLNEAAMAKASHMFAYNYWAHVAPDGTKPWYFFIQAGYKYRFAGENLARDFSNSKDVVDAWLNSPTHRENLLSPRYEDIGIGVVKGELNGVTTTLVVQLFGTKMNRALVAGEKLSEIAQEPKEVATPATVAGKLGNDHIKQNSTHMPFKIPPFYVIKWVSLVLGLLFTVVVFLDIGFVKMRKIERVASRSIAHLFFFILVLAVAYLAKVGNIL